MTPEDKTLLSLVRMALKNSSPESEEPLGNPDWDKVMSVANRHGLLAIAFDGLTAAGVQLDMRTRLKWIGMVSHNESRYGLYLHVIERLAAFYQAHGYRMMILKGYDRSLDWPVPNHRPMGDIDIYILKADGTCPKDLYKEADQLLEKELGVVVDNTHHHHSVFHINGLMFENHYDFLNQYAHKSNQTADRYLKAWATEGFSRRTLGRAEILLPSPDLNALFLLKHATAHFAAIDMNLRQLVDWLLFIQKRGHEVNWEKLRPVFDELNQTRICGVLNTIGVRYFGFDASLFPMLEEDAALVDRVLEEILSPGFKEREKGTLRSALWVKPRRWWHNRWKNRLCYSDSLLSTFLHSFHAKLVKPDHFSGL